MGLGDVLRSLMGKEEKKTFTPPDVKFMEDEDPTGVTHTMPIAVESPTTQIIIKHEGQILVYKNMDEMPPDLREELQHLDEAEDFTHSYSVIVDGERQNYAEFNDMPEDIRQAIEAKQNKEE